MRKNIIATFFCGLLASQANTTFANPVEVGREVYVVYKQKGSHMVCAGNITTTGSDNSLVKWRNCRDNDGSEFEWVSNNSLRAYDTYAEAQQVVDEYSAAELKQSAVILGGAAIGVGAILKYLVDDVKGKHNR